MTKVAYSKYYCCGNKELLTVKINLKKQGKKSKADYIWKNIDSIKFNYKKVHSTFKKSKPQKQK